MQADSFSLSHLGSHGAYCKQLVIPGVLRSHSQEETLQLCLLLELPNLSSDFPGGSVVKHLSTMRETQVRALVWEDPLEKAMAIHSSTIAWKIPWTEEPGRLQSMGSQRVGQD